MASIVSLFHEKSVPIKAVGVMNPVFGLVSLQLEDVTS